MGRTVKKYGDTRVGYFPHLRKYIPKALSPAGKTEVAKREHYRV
jgi:hypothetical protein